MEVNLLKYKKQVPLASTYLINKYKTQGELCFQPLLLARKQIFEP